MKYLVYTFLSCLLLCASLFYSCSEATDWGYDEVSPPDTPNQEVIKQDLLDQPEKARQSDKEPAPYHATTKYHHKKIPNHLTNKQSLKYKNNALTNSKISKSVLPQETNIQPLSNPAIHQPIKESNDPYVNKDQQAIFCWLQLLQLVSKNDLPYTTQKKIETYLLIKAQSNEQNHAQVLSILQFYPKLTQFLKDKPELEPHYADLFHALLRIHERNSQNSLPLQNAPYTDDAQLLTEILGLERIAVAGDPQFTEEAVDAYADMACFIYEQKTPGKTVDAIDNRALFARVIAERFKDAPTNTDRNAMANFDLTWAKFKIFWFSADEKTRKLLLEKLTNQGTNSTLTVAKNPMLELVLTNWPWKV